MDLQRLLVDTLDAVARAGAWGPVLFVAAYVLACVLFIPGSLLTLGAGAVYGVGRGVPLVSLASTLGATAAFLVGRYVARDWVARKLGANAKFKAVDEAVGRGGWKIVLLTRLSPVFPFNLLNYGLGLTKVSLREYVAASWAGMLPATVVFVYIGSLIGDVARLGAGGRQRTPAEWALYALGLAATGGVLAYVTRLAREELRRQHAA